MADHTDPPFDPAHIEEFLVYAPEFDRVTGRIELSYALDDHPFTEVVTIPIPEHAVSATAWHAAEALAVLLAAASGVSYYKAACPGLIDIAVPLTDEAQDLVRAVYGVGLSEFAYRNNVSTASNFVFLPAEVDELPIERLATRPLVPIGGGKDSFVTYDALVANDVQPLGFAVKDPPAIRRALNALGGPSIVADRVIDPYLVALNSRGALNGHIPVTVIVSLIALITATLHDCDAVLLSNEASADEGNVIANGVKVNHQWAKSSEAEQLLRDAVRTMAPNAPEYASFLRPFGELRIARAFAENSDRLDVFTSCNAAFRLDPAARGSGWCRNCPKCRFVFLALAGVVERPRLVDVFGGDMLDDPTQVPGFTELLGLTAVKPFECVGTTSECRVAFDAARSGDWSNSAVVLALSDRVGLVTDTERADAFAEQGPHQVPARYRRSLTAI